ncbi:hypothetical protein QTP88_001473 [Uroleucon formosanum]
MSLKPYSFEPNVSDIDSFEPNYSVSLCLPNVQGRAQVEVNEWCNCENCAKMSNDLESKCCSEFDNVKQLLDSKKCVTATASFEKIILDEEILNITRQQMIMKTKNKLKKKQLSAAKEVVTDNIKVEGEQEEYFVEKILNKRIRNNKVEYFLKWTGYNDIYNTWEPVEYLKCDDLIKEFEKSKQQENKKKEDIIVRSRKRALNNSTAKICSLSEPGTSNDCNNSSFHKLKSKVKKTNELSEAGSSKECTINLFHQRNIKTEKSDESNKSDLTKNNDNYDEDENSVSEEIENVSKTTLNKKEGEEIIGATKLDGQLVFLMKWKGIDKADLISSKEAYSKYPRITFKYYETNLKWNHQPKNNNSTAKICSLSEPGTSNDCSNSSFHKLKSEVKKTNELSEAGSSKECTINLFHQRNIKTEKSDESNKSDLTKNNDIYDEDENSVSEEIENVSKTTLNKKEGEEIIGATKSDGQLIFLMKWKGIDKADLISSKEAYSKYSQITFKYYETNLKWNRQPKNNN